MGNDKSNKISKYRHIEFRSLQFSLQLVMGITIIDREKSMIFEIKDDTKDTLSASSGYINIYRRQICCAILCLYYLKAYGNKQKMYQELQAHDRIQKEFINTAAHELRTPIQPILGITESLRSKTKDRHKELLDVIGRNTKKLKKLAEDILDVSKIESNSMGLDKEHFRIVEAILDNITTSTKTTQMAKA